MGLREGLGFVFFSVSTSPEILMPNDRLSDRDLFLFLSEQVETLWRNYDHYHYQECRQRA